MFLNLFVRRPFGNRMHLPSNWPQALIACHKNLKYQCYKHNFLWLSSTLQSANGNVCFSQSSCHSFSLRFITFSRRLLYTFFVPTKRKNLEDFRMMIITRRLLRIDQRKIRKTKKKWKTKKGETENKNLYWCNGT